MIFEMGLNKEPFTMMQSGKKSVELRLFDENRRRLNPGDRIVFTCLPCEEEKLAVEVTALHRYRTFEELFAEISPARCGFDEGTSVEAAANGMKKYYSRELICAYGVLGIDVELVDLEETLELKAREEAVRFERYFMDGMK